MGLWLLLYQCADDGRHEAAVEVEKSVGGKSSEAFETEPRSSNLFLQIRSQALD
jgi:hypothetical protein